MDVIRIIGKQCGKITVFPVFRSEFVVTGGFEILPELFHVFILPLGNGSDFTVFVEFWNIDHHNRCHILPRI